MIRPVSRRLTSKLPTLPMHTDFDPSPASDHPANPVRPAVGRTNRREFLRLLGLGFLASYTTVPFGEAEAAARDAQPDPFGVRAVDDAGTTFPQSVASGDPTPSGMILWTRLLPAVVTGTDPLLLEVALDAAFSQIQLRVNVPASQITPTLDNTVRVDLDRHLRPNTIYYYRFIYQNVSSRTGRARTLPLANDATVSSLKFAVLNCQDYTNGYYGAYAFIAADSTIDYVLHVGDFIYETTGGTGFQSGPFPDRNIILPTDPASQAALGLADYRFLYQTYRGDSGLRDTLENFTWMTIWDDHEMANDQYHDYTDTEYPSGSQGAPDHPYTTSPQSYQGGAKTSAQLLHQLKLDSQQAWFEYGAVRVGFNQSSADIFGRLQIYRNFRFGTLVEFFLTDERTYRSSHPEGESVPGVPSGFGARYLAPSSPPLVGQNDPSRTMLGATQRAAFVNSVGASGALWKAWANEVLLAPLQIQVTAPLLAVLPAPLSQLLAATIPIGGFATVDNDSWDGYAYERTQINTALRDAGVQNLVVLTGDLHTYVASYVKADYTSGSNANAPGTLVNVIGVEYMTPAITSSNLQEQLGLGDQAEAGLEQASLAVNPHLQYLNSHQYGYATVEFTRDHCDYTMYVVDKSTPTPAPAVVVKQFRTPVGQPLITDITPAAKASRPIKVGVPVRR